MTNWWRNLSGLGLGLVLACEGNGTAPSGTSEAIDVSPAVAATRIEGATLQCEVNAGGPAYSYLTVTGVINREGITNVNVFQTYGGQLESVRDRATVVSNYGTTPSFPRYRAWDVTGHANGVGTPDDLFYLVIPKVMPGVGGVVPGEVHVEFAGGGGWQAIGLCLVG